MRNRTSLTLSVLFTLCASVSFAQQPVAWESSIENAQRVAMQTNRLVLVHFWASWCAPCMRMESDVFSQPAVAAQIQANFVPVKLNADSYQALATKYGVSMLPCDVILNAQGTVIDVKSGGATAPEYIARINQVAATARRAPGVVASAAPVMPQPAPTASIPAQPQQRPAAPASDSRYADYAQRMAQQNPAAGQSYAAATNPVIPAPTYAQQPSMPQNPAMTPGYPTNPQIAPANPGVAANQNLVAASPTGFAPQAAQNPANLQPPVNAAAPQNPSSPNASAKGMPKALDGCCPVSLIMKRAWVPGDKRYGAIHLGQVYLFAGPAEQQQFLADPYRFAPVLNGNDVVQAFDAGKTVPGKREFGCEYSGHIFIFADEVSYDRFTKNPQYYANQALQAMRLQTVQR